MAVGDVVTILVEYCEDGAETFRARHGPERAAAVRDLIDLVKQELSSQLEFDALWAGFQAAPREIEPDLQGALEAMIEADPGLADRMRALTQEYYGTGRAANDTVGGDALETEASTTEDWRQRASTARRSGPERHTDDAGEGTYLYGNVPGGDASLERGLDMDDLVESYQGTEGVRVDLDGLFERLQTTVEGRSTLSEEARSRLRDELEGLRGEILLGDEASEDWIVEHLRWVADIDLDFLNLVLTGMSHGTARTQAAVESAIDRAGEWLRDE